MIKYGRSDVLKNLGVEIVPYELKEPEGSHDLAKELAEDLKKLGPTFIKLGQFLSTQTDFLPESFQDALADLQDQVPPFPFSEVERIFYEEVKIFIKDAFLEIN